jgi:hypothetical protein
MAIVREDKGRNRKSCGVVISKRNRRTGMLNCSYTIIFA